MAENVEFIGPFDTFIGNDSHVLIIYTLISNNKDQGTCL